MATDIWTLEALPGFSGTPTSWTISFNSEIMFTIVASIEPSNMDKIQTASAVVKFLNDQIFSPVFNKMQLISSQQAEAINQQTLQTSQEELPK